MLKRTILYPVHLKLGATMGEFAGWNMPLWYKGIHVEHNSVRENVGIFDISHMGRLRIKGKDAEKLLQRTTTVNIVETRNLEMKIGFICNENGGIIDDISIYRLNNDDFLLVTNAVNIEKDHNWLEKHGKNLEVKIEDISDATAMLAIQGPKTVAYIKDQFDEALQELKWFSAKFIEKNETRILASRSGYTGEDGYELYIWYRSREEAFKIWSDLVNTGISPCGLGARDLLRLECGFLLYGMDEDESVTPVETNKVGLVDLNKEDFIGKHAIEEKIKKGVDKLLVGLLMEEPGIPRNGYHVWKDDELIGQITSGNLSPTLKRGIALAHVEKGFAK
ncbi:glycine cleavage system aminomethyltransferase GcvT, partial [Candidatus Bathyarchaeota archaeon]|nr:glycine cleavage system aminomethyltransferase GcvT [Candidatus Bathyarchaeota archaeon]